MLKFILFSILLTNICIAQLPPLVKTFVQRSIPVKIDKLGVKQEKELYHGVLIGKTLKLSGAFNYDDNRLDTSSTMNLSSAKNTTLTLGFSKSFFSGTTLQLNSTLLNVDRSAVNSAWLGSSPTVVNQFQQEVVLTQDLGRNFLGHYEQLGREASFQRIGLAQLVEQEQLDQKVAQFYKSYLRYVEALQAEKLQQLAYRRAIQRTTLVRQKWRDGLSTKADLLQAQGAQMQQQEQLSTSVIAVSAAQAELIAQLGQKVDSFATDIDYSIYRLPQQKLERSLHYLRLKKELDIGQLELVAQERALRPKVEFTIAYKTNDYDAQRSETLLNGNLIKGEHEVRAGLNISSSWGLQEQQHKVALQKIDHYRKQLVLEQYGRDFTAKQQQYLQEVELLKVNLLRATQREKIARAALAEYTRLYRLGKSDLDQLIRAEEALISTQQAKLSYYIKYEMRAIDLSLMYGGVLSYLKNRVVEESGEKSN